MMHLLQMISLWLAFCVPFAPTETATTPEKKNVTEIYLVRHAEKDTTDRTNKDPELSGEGLKRAQDLKKLLKKKKPAVIFSSPYKRTQNTARPLAEALQQEIKTYDPGNLKAFATQLLAEHKGKKILIVGHSNTLLETIEALGIERPIAKIDDREYYYVFHIKIEEGKKAVVKTMKYGEQTAVQGRPQKMN